MLASSSRSALKRSRAQLATLVPSAGAAPHISNTLFFQSQRNASLLAKADTTHERSNNRHDLWSFTPDLQFQGSTIPRAGALGRYNVTIADLAAQGNFTEVLRLCAKMKSEGVMPDIMTYNSLISACARGTLHMEAWAIYDDMLAFGLRPDRETFHRLLQVNRRRPISVSLEIWSKMRSLGVKPNLISYEFLIQRFTMDGNLESALLMLTNMEDNDLSPSAETAERIISLAARLGNARLAVDLATSYEAESVRPLPSQAWVHCLSSCAGSLYADGVEVCWNKVVRDLRITPDEGLCLEVLHTASRYGLPVLAADVFRVLTDTKTPLQEYHFGPLVEAFCTSGMIKDALATLTLMRDADVHPDSGTTYPICRVIQSSPDYLESACTAVEQLRDGGKTVHLSALNCIIQASVGRGDLQRAVGTFNSFPTFDAKPDVETFNLLLEGCVAAAHRDLGDKLLLEMKEAAIQPNSGTYESLIMLCLTQTTYEDAFFYLEEMKGLKLVPPVSIYEALVQKCVSMGDTRYKLAVEEMAECGYSVSKKLQTFIDSGGEKMRERETQPAGSQNYNKGVNRHKRHMFIQNG